MISLEKSLSASLRDLHSHLFLLLESLPPPWLIALLMSQPDRSPDADRILPTLVAVVLVLLLCLPSLRIVLLRFATRLERSGKLDDTE